MTRAPQPGLLCRAWFRHTARRNRKATLEAAALKVARERARTLFAASDSGGKLTTKGSGRNSVSVAYSNAQEDS